jgi:hypothetical protein
VECPQQKPTLAGQLEVSVTVGKDGSIQIDSLTPDEREYRSKLIQLEQHSQDSADKTVIALASGALGISFAFIKQFVGNGVAKSSHLIAIAWVCWVLSLTLVLVGHYIAALAARAALTQFDARDDASRVGGGYDLALTVLNPAGIVAFVIGLIFAGVFVVKNLN